MNHSQKYVPLLSSLEENINVIGEVDMTATPQPQTHAISDNEVILDSHDIGCTQSNGNFETCE